MPDPFESVREALADAGAKFDPTNAKAVRDWYAGLTPLVESLTGMFNAHGQKLDSDFHQDPSAAEISRGLGGVFGRFGHTTSEAASTFERAHADDLRRIDEPAPNQHKWDILKNQE